MRKGLVVTLGVALVLAVAPGFAEAPLLSCIPDVVITDFDQGAQTADTNMFVFTDALNLDEYVQDADTSDSLIRWSFIETTGSSLRFNGKESATPAEILEPGAKNIRGANGLVTIENVEITSAATQPMQATVQLWASDGTSSASQTITVTTINTDGSAGSQASHLVPPVLGNYTFDTDAQGWTWFDLTGQFIVPTHQWSGGELQMTEAAGHTQIVYGGYEAPKDPAVGFHPKMGCIIRARFDLKSNAASPAATPGFRLRAYTGHMVEYQGIWSPDFSSQDFLDEQYTMWGTLDFVALAGREPGTGKTYTQLSYPQQVAETLLASDVVTYFTCELLDQDGAIQSDQGTISITGVTVDAIDRPDVGTGTAVPELTTSSFVASSWTSGKANLGAGYNDSNLTVGVTGGQLGVTVQPGNAWFEAYIENTNGVRLQPGKYYRLLWSITSSTSGDNFGPRVRVALASERFIWISVKEIAGGALLAGFETTPKDMEHWTVAPSADPANGAGLTEPMKARFESWLTDSSTGWPFYKTVSGTIRALSLTTEAFDAVP